MFDNICSNTDAYKASHPRMYPPGTEAIYSYLESRKGGRFDNTVFFGLRYILEKHLFPQVTQQKIDRASKLFRHCFGSSNVFNQENWEYILHNHNGRLPLIIQALPEGTVAPSGTVLMTVENTDTECYWLTNWVETVLTQVWYPCTVATQSREMKKIILKYLIRTGDPSLIEYKLHCFGFRGVSCVEQAGIGSAAHLVNFQGTDTMPAIELVNECYQGRNQYGHSIPASEHSTITSWGSEHELDAMRNILDQFPTGMVACVSDSYNIDRACSEFWGGALKDKIINRNGTLVVRPDSGPPDSSVVTVLSILSDRFGYTRNDKGFKVLPSCIRVIQGDGIDIDSLSVILSAVEAHGFSADNVSFGSGGGLLQKVNRDTNRFAFKCSSATINGEYRDVFKNPANDKSKTSKAGRFSVVRDADGIIRTKPEFAAIGDNLLEVAFWNGMIIDAAHNSFENIRKRAALR